MNLPYSMRGKALREVFEEVGSVVRSEVEMSGGKSRGWGIVTMSTPEEAVKAVEKLDGTTVQGTDWGKTTERQIKVGLEKRALWINNVPYDARVQDIKGVFKETAVPRWVNLGLFRNETINGRPKSRGHAVAIFSSEEDAQKALSKNELELRGRTLYVGHI